MLGVLEFQPRVIILMIKMADVEWLLGSAAVCWDILLIVAADKL